MLDWTKASLAGLLLVVGCASDDSASYGGEDSGLTAGGTSGWDGADEGDSASGAGTSGADSGGDTGGDIPEDPDNDEEQSEDSGEEEACDDETPVTLYLSPDDSNSMSSPVQVRSAVLDGFSSIDNVPIRTWEFLNYYKFDYPAADAGGLVVTPSLYHDDSMAEGEYVLQIGVSSEAVASDARAPINVTLVLDTSGSMEGPPIEMLKASSRAIVGSLRDGDVLSMVTWDTENAVVMSNHAVSGPNDAIALDHIAAINAGGGTDLHGGLTAGYAAAQEAYNTSRINRIVLISDGGANTGVTDIEIIAENAGGNNEEGVYMVGVGVGEADSYRDELMDEVTDAGKGASVFIHSVNEAGKIFGTDFVNTMAVAARDVRVQLDLPPGFEIVRFSGEEYSSDPEEVEPQHVAPNDAMVFHQHIVTCAPDLVEDDTPIGITVQYKDAITFEEHELTSETTFSELLGTVDPQLLKGAAVFEYAEALKAYQQAGHFTEEENAALAPALEALTRAEEALPEDDDLTEIRAVLEALSN